jgi:hypothetical protein
MTCGGCDTRCDDGLFCNGLETCDAVLGCQSGVSPCQPGLVCVEQATEALCVAAPDAGGEAGADGGQVLPDGGSVNPDGAVSNPDGGGVMVDGAASDRAAGDAAQIEPEGGAGPIDAAAESGGDGGGALADSGTSVSKPDAGGGEPPVNGGCGCAQQGAPAIPALFVGAVLLGLTLRRRFR